MSNGHDGRQKADSIESASFCCGGKLAPSPSFFCKVFRTLGLGLDLQAKVFISLGLSVKYSMQRETARNASHSGRSLVLSLLPVYGGGKPEVGVVMRKWLTRSFSENIGGGIPALSAERYAEWQ